MSDQKTTILEVLQQQFKELEGQMNGTTNSAGHLARKSAFASFKKIGLPNRRNEEYKYTPFASQLEKHFESFVANPEAAESAINHSQLPDLNGSMLVFVNGNYHQELSNVIREDGLGIQIATSQNELMKHTSSTLSSTDAYSGLNLALATTGVKIIVEKSAVIKEPINIVHLTNSNRGRVLSTLRHEIIIGENAQATVSEIFIGDGKHSSFTNSSMEVSVGAYGILNHYKVGIDDDNDLRIDNTTCRQQNNSVLNTINVNYGGKIVRNNLNIIIEGEYCETNLAGLYIPAAHGNIDNHTIVDHTVPNCNSNELYKGILGDYATGVFNGKVFVRQHAQKTNAFQSNKNILLADTATINTKPQLEIWADDVKCSHGCTTGQMDKEQLFYLRTRGIDITSARKLLLKAFAEEVIEKFKDHKLRARVAAILEEKLAV